MLKYEILQCRFVFSDLLQSLFETFVLFYRITLRLLSKELHPVNEHEVSFFL